MKNLFSTAIFCAVLSAAVAPSVAIAATAAEMREMSMGVPLMDKVPIIDGVVDPAEWKGASGSFGFVRFGSADGTIEPVGSEFWIGRTSDRLFFAGTGRVGPYGLLRTAKARRGNVSCMGDDTYEIVLVPDVSARSPDVRHIIVNFNGAYHVQSLVDNKMSAWLPETMETKSSIRGGQWHFEWSVSLDEIGFTKALADRHAIRFVRNFKQVDSQWGYQSSMRPDDGSFFAAAKAVPVRFDDDAVSVFLDRGETSNPSRWLVKLRIHNPTAVGKCVHVSVEGRPENSQPGSLVKTLSVGAGETVVLPVEGAILGDEYVKLSAEVECGGKTVFLREVGWRPNGPAPRWLKSGEKGGAFRFDFAYYPSHDKMRLRADMALLEKRPAEVPVEIRSDANRSRDVLAATTLKIGKDGVADVLWDVPDLKAETLRTGVGGYTVTATAKGVKDGVVKKEFRRDVFEWEGFKGGTSDAVPSRFEEVRRRPGSHPGEEVVSVVLRDHFVDSRTGLWRQVVAAGKPVLARPMSISPLPLGFRVATEWDVDGMMTWRLTLPAGRCAPVSLEIPLIAERANLLHPCADGLRFNYAGAVPPGIGCVWDGTKATRNSIVGDYMPYVWVGGPLRGIAVFGENDRGWVLDDADGGKTPCQEVVREADGTVVLRLNLVQKACDIKKPRTILLGFQATPTKPMEKDWRSSPIGNLLGSCYYWGGYSASDEIHPYDGTDTFWRKMSEVRRTGKVDKAYVERAIAERVFHCPTNSPRFADTMRCFRAHFYSGMNNMASSFGTDKKFVWYTNGRGVRLGNPEGTTFADEWTREAFSSRPFEWGATKSYSLDPNRTYLDFAAWWWEKALSLGVVDYFYWDDIFCTANFDLVGTDSYRMEDGDIQPATGIFNQRAQVRRCAVLQREHGWRDDKNWVHMTNTALAPVLSFAGMNYDWEDTSGDMAIQERYSRECILAQSIGRQFGNQVAVMGYFATKDPKSEKLKWLHRTGVGACLAHELQWTRVKEWREAYGRLSDWGYKLPTTRVWNYWDEDVPFPVDVKGGVAATLAMAKPGGEALVVVSDFESGGDYAIAPDAAALGLKPGFRAYDFETGAELPVVKGAVGVRLSRLDYVIVAFCQGRRNEP